MPEKFDLMPFVGPLLKLLRSRKFMVAVMTLVIDVLIAYAPALEPVRGELLSVFTLVGSLLVAAIAYEDGQSKASEAQNGS
ncbi:MAG TPA: hypothetical protein ENI95_10985 [Chloroflexi bacterium]|nr:hypothetical protein [Chloroflexota bacterium]